MLQKCLALSSEHNKLVVFHQSRLHYNLSVVIHTGSPRYQKKAQIFKEFLGILESFWRIVDISKRILEVFFGEITERILCHISRIM